LRQPMPKPDLGAAIKQLHLARSLRMFFACGRSLVLKIFN
jgi:hypothetical protein